MGASQPGRISSTNPVRKLRCMLDGGGIMSATTRPPCSAAAVPARSFSFDAVRFARVGRTTFQFSGRCAAADIATIKRTASELSGSCGSVTSGRNSRDVPAYSRHTPARAISSAGSANREGTGSPLASLWLRAYDDENPMPPTASPWRSRDAIASISSVVAVRSLACSPITMRRIAECPTMNPAFTDGRPSRRSRYSDVEVQSHGGPLMRASSDIPSTLASIRHT